MVMKTLPHVCGGRQRALAGNPSVQAFAVRPTRAAHMAGLHARIDVGAMQS
jgi:hypothetical protein